MLTEQVFHRLEFSFIILLCHEIPYRDLLVLELILVRKLCLFEKSKKSVCICVYVDALVYARTGLCAKIDVDVDVNC